jgi:transposase
MATYPVSMRKSFDGLMNEVRFVIKGDPLSGHVFVFINKKRTMVKLLVWTRGGYTIIHKRLERGRYKIQHSIKMETQSKQIEEHELMMLLEGVCEKKVRYLPRWERSILK